MQMLLRRAAWNSGICRFIQSSGPNAPTLRGLGAFRTTSTLVSRDAFANTTIDARAKETDTGKRGPESERIREAMTGSGFVEDKFGAEMIDVETHVEHLVVEENLQARRRFGHALQEDILNQGYDLEAIAQAAGNELVDEHSSSGQPTAISVDHVEDLWELLSFDSRFPGVRMPNWPVNTGPNLVRHYLPPQSLWAHDHVRRKALQRRLVPKKIIIQEMSMGILIRSLVERAQLYSSSDDVFADTSYFLQRMGKYEANRMRNQKRRMGRAMRTLTSLPSDTSESAARVATAALFRFIKPEYVQDDNGDFYRECAELNASIKKLFSTGGAEPAKTLARVAHNLLVSSSPPDVQTFNMLITNFKRWNLSSLVEDTIAALKSSYIRPNEVTCVAILDHYIKENQPTRFSNFVARMRGVGDALMLANPNVNINEASQGRLVRVSESKVYQKVYPTPLVFHGLMLGVLKFAGIERALEIYHEMKQDGWGLGILSLCHFLDECIHEADWDNGMFVWEEINSILVQAEESHASNAYARMMALCSVTGNTAAFNHLLTEVVRVGLNRKRILDSAKELARRSRSHRAESSEQEEQTTAAPAWAADNVLIAVSDYMGEVKTEPKKLESYMGEKKLESKRLEEPKKLDLDAAWSAWMAHEFGSKPSPPASPTEQHNPESVQTPTDPTGKS